MVANVGLGIKRDDTLDGILYEGRFPVCCGELNFDDVQRFRTACLVLMAIMTAAIVSFTGIIGFVGLVAPHLVRMIIGSDNRFVAPISMVMGALLLLIADYIAFELSNIPVGVVMSIIGSPVFFALIIYQSRKPGVIY